MYLQCACQVVISEISIILHGVALTKLSGSTTFCRTGKNLVSCSIEVICRRGDTTKCRIVGDVMDF